MIKDAPQRIFLQMGSDENEEFPETVTFDELEGVTWSDDRLNDTDLEYIRIEEYARLREALEWYANSDNYMFNDTQLATAWGMNKNIEKKAREALQQEGGTE